MRTRGTGAQLGFEDFGPGQADAQCAHTHGGVILLGQVKVADLLVRADVQRADDDLLAVHVRQHLLVGFKLLILGGIVRRVQVEELGAEQADAAAVVDLHGMHILRRANVAVDADGLAVLRYVGLALERFQQALQAQLLVALFQQAVTGVVVGVDDQRTVLPSAMAARPSSSGLSASPMPTIAGMPSVRARMAVWLERGRPP